MIPGHSSGANLSSPTPPIRLFADAPKPRVTRYQHLLSDPFRLFFVIGWVAGFIGLILWPLFFLGWAPYPVRTHAFLMIQGFFAAFAAGFLWTALPRMIEVRSVQPKLLLSGLALAAGLTVAHLAGLHLIGHLLFLGLIGAMIGFAAVRFPLRRDLPPPSFVLVAMGMASAIAGTCVVALGNYGWITGAWYSLGHLLFMEVFLLFLVMGVAAFLAPRFLGHRSRQAMPESLKPSAAWKKQAGLAAGAGVVVLLGAFLQAFEAVRSGAFLMAVAITAYVLYQVPIHKRSASPSNWLGHGLRVALFFSILAPWFRFMFPEARLASTHLLLLGGFGLLTLVIGTRVTFGHSGYEHLFRARLPSVGVITCFYAAAMIARVAAELSAVVWRPALVVSVVLVLGAHLVWGYIALPKLLRRPVSIAAPPASPTRILPGFPPVKKAPSPCCGHC
jgi:uncharacterized protein involved in response to NO